MWIERHGDDWRIRDRVGGRVITLGSGIPNKGLARNLLAQYKADRVRGDALVPRGGETALSDWIDDWWPSYEVTLKPSARMSSAGLISRYIRPMLGHLRLDELERDPVLVQRWVADL